MKKLRKAVALLVGTVMALSSMPQMAFAEKTDDAYMYGWYVSGPEQNDNIKAYVDNNESVTAHVNIVVIIGHSVCFYNLISRGKFGVVISETVV